MRLLWFTVAILILTSCQTGRKTTNAITIENPLIEHRAPASVQTPRQVGLISGREIFVSDTDRCEEAPLSQAIDDLQVTQAKLWLSSVSIKLDEVLRLIAVLNPDLEARVSTYLQRFAFVLDGADSVVCGGTAATSTIGTESRPVIFLSLKGATLESWNTVVVHEFFHLVMKGAGLDGGPLRESFPDLVAISFNQFQPYFAAGDGERTIEFVKSQGAQGKQSALMQEMLSHSCLTIKAQRDFSNRSDLASSYRDLAIHNISCDFVGAFLATPISISDRRLALFKYLFSGSNREASVGRVNSYNFARILNNLQTSKRFEEPSMEMELSALAELSLDHGAPTIRFKIPDSVRSNIQSGSLKAIGVELVDKNQNSVVTSRLFLGNYEPLLKGTIAETCSSVSDLNCYCTSSPLKTKFFYLTKKKVPVQLTSKNEISLPNGCFVFREFRD